MWKPKHLEHGQIRHSYRYSQTRRVLVSVNSFLNLPPIRKRTAWHAFPSRLPNRWSVCEKLGEGVSPVHKKGEEVISYDLIQTWEAVIGVSNELIIMNEQDMSQIEKRNPEWARSMREHRVRSLMLIPLRRSGRVIGYIGMSAVIDEGYLFNVAVDRQYRKKGVGSALVRELVTFCQKRNYAFLTLEVRESNAPAISLYSRFGFVRVGERKNYYSKPVENALLMTKYF